MRTANRRSRRCRRLPRSSPPRLVRLHRKHQAGTDDIAIDAHCACAAHPVLTSDMRACQLEVLAKKIRQIAGAAIHLASICSPLTTSEIGPELSRRGPRVEIRAIKQRGYAARQQHLRQMPAHGRCRLLIFQRIEFLDQAPKRVGQHLRRDGNVDQFAGRAGQQRAIADGKETKAKIGERPPLTTPSLRVRRLRSRHAGERIRERNASNSWGRPAILRATNSSCGASAVS